MILPLLILAAQTPVVPPSSAPHGAAAPFGSGAELVVQCVAAEAMALEATTNGITYQTCGTYTRNSMRRLASLFAIFILLSTAAPLMACVTGSAMNQRESACCRAMHGNCGDMAKMGCCRTEIRSDEHPQLVASAPSFTLHFVVVNWFAPFLVEPQAVPPSLLRIPDAHSPPGLLIARTTVLRI